MYKCNCEEKSRQRIEGTDFAEKIREGFPEKNDD